MIQLLIIRERVQKFYQKYANFFNIIFRFAIGLIVFWAVNRVIGYNPMLKNVYAEFALAVISVIFPLPVLLFLSSAFMVAQIFYVSRYLALVVAVILAVLYFLYVRFLPKHGYVIMAMPILFALHIPYALPILMGLIASPIAVVSIGFGVTVYFLIENVVSVISMTTEDSFALYRLVVKQLFADEQLYSTIVIFALITVIVYIIRKRSFNYAFETAAVTGTILMVIMFLITNYAFDISMNIAELLLGSLVSLFIVTAVQFFRLALNYAAVEELQFEDDDYYYYVKAVPKMNIAAASKMIKRFNVHNEDESENETEDEVKTVESEQKEESEHDFNFTVSLDKEDLEEMKQDEYSDENNG